MAECEELVESSGADEDMPRVVAALAGILERVAERNDAAAELSAVAPASAFRATTKPGISVRAYAARIAQFAGCSPACYAVAYVYLDRLLRRGRRLALAVDSYSVHRLLITAVLAAVKFMDDICYNNAYFAKVGGISLVEMNYLEVDFLFGVGFDLNVAPETFGDYCAVLQSELLCSEAPPAPLRLQYCCLSEDDAAGAGCSAQQQLAA
ncbi:Cyclin-P4-1 [Dichanthelium oligosanthes]|uniref:Cyclin-P4-1 n=1 Tax=Dichanthelium oligosanthes TaxID=888268 RepID=A0A1E5VTW7_9POAL|nr:Cyclin-P4-1 [Dichanthelium oligosanthes]